MSRELIIEKLRPYQTHPDATSVAASVEWHIRNARLNETALRVLRVLQFRSKIVYGAAWLKLETIADVIGKSVRTVRRALRQLEQAEVIDTYFQTREKSGGDGASVFTIRPVISIVRANVRPSMSARSEDENTRHAESEGSSAKGKDDSLKKHQEKNEVYTSGGDEDKPLGKDFVPDTIPEAFVNVVWPYLRDAVKVHRLYTRAIIAAKQLGDYRVRDHVAVQAFKATVFALKAGKVKSDMFAYFYGTYKALAVADIRREAAEARGIDLHALFGADEETA